MTSPVSRRRFLSRTALVATGGAVLAGGGSGLLSALLPRPALAAPVVGAAAPDFSATDIAGQAVRLADLRGRTVVLEWTNHLCPFVMKHYGGGNMQALQRDYTGKGVVWITVVSSAEGQQGHVTPEEAQRIVDEAKAAPTHKILDPKGTIGRAYAAKTTPHMFVIDPAGLLVYDGAIDDRPTARLEDLDGATSHVRAALDATLAGQPVAVPTSQPYGCTIKYAKDAV